VTALREQVALLESERPKMRAQLEAREQELAGVTESRKSLMVEASALHNELKAKSALVTDVLEKQDVLRLQAAEAEAAKTLAENQVAALQAELEQLRAEAEKSEAAERNFALMNPAATYDSNQSSVFTIADYEELQHRLHATSEENEAHALEAKSLRKEVDTLRRKVAKLPECIAHIERLEKRTEKLQSANETLREERMEEQAVLDSLRSMNLVYKKIAESRPFAADCTCAQQPEEADPQTLGVTVRDVLIETNMKLEAELRELRAAMDLPHVLSENAEEEALEQALKRVGSSSSNGSAVSDTTISSGESMETANERLSRKLQLITEKYNLSKEMLRHTKVQWCAAVASQKALEECNQSAQDEISRLTQQLDYHIAALANTDADDKEKQIRALVDGDESGKWTEETAPFPAPPGDLNSPLIRCLLDHWSTDKSKVMALTDWLHNSIRGTGRATPLRLVNLTSEVAAGFTQLLVPIMRERHGVSVSVYRRDSVHVLSDLVLQTNHPSVTVQSYSRAASKEKVVPTHPRDPEETSESEVDSASCRTRGSSGDSALLKGEAQFLYG
jgi:polyhydroxyalkanoate synthesis regulator protein